MPPPVRKAANNSSSGVGIIRSFRNRPVFSFAHTAEDRPLTCPTVVNVATESQQAGSLFAGQAKDPSSSIFFCFRLFRWNFGDSGRIDSCFDKSAKP